MTKCTRQSENQAKMQTLAFTAKKANTSVDEICILLIYVMVYVPLRE
jgi:hypothetical protein